MPQLRAPDIGVINTQMLMMPWEHDFIWTEKWKMRKKEVLVKGKQLKILEAASRDKWFAHRNEEWPPFATTRESPRTETKTQHSQNK